MVEITEQAHADRQQAGHHNQRGGLGNQETGLRRAGVTGGYVALDSHLVGTIGRQPFQETADQDGESAKTDGRIQPEIEHHPLPVAEIGFDDLRRASLGPGHQQDSSEQDGADKDEELDHVGPHHRPQATEHRVDDRHHAQPDDHQVLVQTRDARDGHRGGECGRCHPGDPQHDEQAAGQAANRDVESLFEILVRGGTFEFRIDRDEDPDHQRCRRQEGHAGQHDPQAVAVGRRGIHHEAVGRKQRRHHAQADSHPAHRTARRQELVPVRLPAQRQSQPQ